MDSEPLNPRDLPRIPGYRVEGVLGRGATGTVYRARQLSVDRLVALKVLHPDLVGAKGAEHRLQREARATARLAHPHIISAIDMGELDGLWWYAMELVDGVSLQERIQAGVLSEREALRTFIPIAEALQHAFERGVVHRDVKPANILLERGGRALLVDLGLAFADDDPLVTKSGSTLGTPHYISPEQARDPSTADAQSDLWSLGATMYHAVCGRPPFAGASVAEILSAVLYEPVPDPAALAPQISNGFALVLRKCLARDRSKRYETPAELLADLERVRERRAPNVRRSALEPVAPGRVQRLRRFALAGTAAAAGVIVLWYGFRGRGEGFTPLDTQSSNSAAAQDPSDRLLAAAEGPAGELGPALARAVQLVRSLPPDTVAAQRAATARAHLEARLAAEIRRFQIAADPRFDKALKEHRYDEGHALAAEGLRREFAASTGGAALPPDLEESLGAWLASLEAAVAKERGAAETKYRAALLEVWRKSVQLDVRSLIEVGRWHSARALLTTGVKTWAEESAIPRAGVPASVVEQSLTRLREEQLKPALAQLDARWEEIDAELRTWVAKRATELRGALEGRTLSDGAAVLRAEWELELERRSLAVAEMPMGLLHLGHEELAKSERELSALTRSLAVDDARRGLAEFEDETQGLWRARKYGEVAELHERALSEAWRQPVRAEHELRAREARLLSALLGRAAASLSARNGERIEVRLGTITLTGRLAAGPDPLNRGFSLALDGGRNPPLALRAGVPIDGVTVVGADMIESLAGFGATPDDRLLRVLFRLREGDPIGARDALDAGALPRDEPLVTDAERRVQLLLDVRRDAIEEQQERARDRYHLALREGREGTEPERLARRIERLLRDDASFLTQEEVQELRRLRDERLAELQPPVPSLEDLMRPNALDNLSNGRVKLRYDFSSLRAGGFDTGTWIQEGKGVVSTRPALSDEDFLSRAAPNLVLREPIHVDGQGDIVDLRLRFQPKSDARPDLLLVSVCGFHVVTVPGRDGRPSRVLVETGDPAAVVAKARAGEEKQLPPRGGQEFELRIVVTRSRGIATVELDGKKLDSVSRPVRIESGNRLIAVRSFEPLRLVSATIEATVR